MSAPLSEQQLAEIRAAAVRAVELHPSTTFMAPCESLADAVLDADVPALLAEVTRLRSERDAFADRADTLIITARADGYQRAIEVMRAERLPMSVGLLEAQRDLDVLDAEGSEAPTAYVMACAQCDGVIGWISCPTGGWWSHRKHPADGHDAEPVPAVALDEGGDR